MSERKQYHSAESWLPGDECNKGEVPTESSLAASGGYAACVAELFALSVEADETLLACKEQGDDEGRIEHRGRRDAYNHALEIVKRHNGQALRPARGNEKDDL